MNQKLALFALILFAGAMSCCVQAGQASGTLESSAEHGAVDLRFDFGSDQSPAGYVAVTADTTYTPDLGYGIDFDTSVKNTQLDGEGIYGDGVSSDRPFFFSVDVPEGNYLVTVSVGPSDRDSDTTIRAETRRLMVENARAAAGEAAVYRFAVNVRNRSLPDGGEVRLKDRELDNWHWDDKLTIEINGSSPRVSAVEVRSAPELATVFLAGDSTVCDQPHEPWNSWGQMLTRFFKPGVAVANHAMSGESIKSSLGARRFDKVFSQIRPGDYLLMQFGHNDMKDKTPDAIGIYEKNLRGLVRKTREHGATPVLITSMERKSGVRQDTLKGYPGVVRRIAAEEDVALIDLHAMSKRLYAALGPDIGKAFVDGTHHNSYGSYELTRCIVQGIRDSGPTLAEQILDDLPDFDPAHPDDVNTFNLPASVNWDPKYVPE